MAQLGTRSSPWLVSFLLVGCGATHTLGTDAGAGRKPDASVKPDGGGMWSVKLVGDDIELHVVGTGRVYVRTCSPTPTLEKRAGDTWVPIRDDRTSPSAASGYYVGDAFVPAHSACAATHCVQLADLFFSTLAYEYVKTGTQPASEASDAGMQYDVIELQPLSGQVRIDFTYFDDAECQYEQHDAVELSVPAQGVCCPVGLGGCSSAGPGGGWAATLDACQPWEMAYDVAFVDTKDPHGCAKLIEDDTRCCLCPKPRDAGL